MGLKIRKTINFNIMDRLMEKLALSKEHYLKVAGALEYHAVLNQKYNESIDNSALSLVE